MATQLPAKLRTGEIQRFSTRATQLEKYKPIVTYWCEYYILQQILNKNLHQSDEECQAYAVHLMDKLEQNKSQNASNDAITDDVAAKAYIENFALETFLRADNAQRANNVTKQTADTFMAAATFLDLLSIWGEVEKEVAAKTRFAKFHASRILKAFKAGEDPNATNPVVEEEPAPPSAEEGIEDELKDLERQKSGVEPGYQPPTVENAEDPASPQIPPTDPDFQPPAEEKGVSPAEPPQSAAEADATARQNSVGGGYFPNVQPTEPDAPMTDPSPAPTQSPQPPINPQDFYNTAATPPTSAPTAPPPSSLGIASPSRPHAPPPDQMAAQPPAIPQSQPPVQQQPAPAPPQPVQHHAPAPPPPGGYKTDDESTTAAQKHARWAISALNFEDVNTAVKELRLALETLGAT